jgi:ATP-dependent helicase/nuclease subunit B
MPNKFQINSLQTLETIEYAECKSLREEAMAVLIKTKEVLKISDRTVAILSDNPSLIKIILSLSQLWGLEIENCFGIPFQELEQIDFMRLLFETIRQNFPPAHLLALLRHKRFFLGKKDFDLDSLIAILERKYLRGIRKYEDLKGLIELVSESQLKIFLWLLHKEFKDFPELMQQQAVQVKDILRELSDLTLRLSDPEDNTIYHELVKITLEGEGLISPHSFLKLFDALIENERFCSKGNEQTRVKIFSLLDSKALESDYTILTGMNEETFAQNRAYDVRIIQGIYELLGVTHYDPEFARIEQSFIALINKKNLLLTRSSIINGSPQTPSRLLIKLELLAKKLKEEKFYNTDLTREARALYVPSEFIKSTLPAPMPPAGSRLKKLSVTQVERLIKDPYSIYASHILKLKKLEAIDKELDRLDFGKFIHGVIDRFSKNYIAGLESQDYFKEVMHYGQLQAADMIQFPSVRIIWIAQLKNLANWIINFEATKRSQQLKIYSEERGSINITLDTGDSFTLSCKADRIELQGGHATIIDFKTGSIPSIKAILSGDAPQLPLEALILQEQGFSNAPALKKVQLAELTYITFSPGSNFGKTISVKENLPPLIAETYSSLHRLINLYNKSTTPFLIRYDHDSFSAYNDYWHLERLEECSVQ